MATKVKGRRLDTGAAVENLGFNPDKRPITGEGLPTDTPDYLGQQYLDTTENKMYFAKALEGDDMREAVGTGSGGGDFDPDGTYPNLHAGLADQIYTDENTISNGEWNFRTTAGDVSVPSSGQASLNHLTGKMIRTVDMTPATFNFTCSAGITVTGFNKYKYLNFIGNFTQTQTATLTDGAWNWEMDNAGITVELATGTTDGTITIEQTAEDAGALIPMKPRYLRATGVNQMGTPGWGRIDNATIQNGQIVSGVNYVYFVRAYGGVTNGYMARELGGGIITVGRCQNRPDFNSQLTQDNIQGDSYQMWMPFEETGWFVVEDVSYYDEYSNYFSIHPRWSNQQGDNVDAYTRSELTLPMYATNWNSLPLYDYGMPSLGDVADEINLQTWKYTKKIERYALDYGQLATLSDDGAVFDYDSNYIYVVKETPEVIDVLNQNGNTYTANDYGTEWLLDENYTLIAAPMEVSTSYGANLVDKLRTAVATKDQLPQVLYQQQYNNLPESKNSDGVIRFIYTCDGPELSNQQYTLANPFTVPSSYIGQGWGVGIVQCSPVGYPFPMSATSSDTNVMTINENPYWSGDYVALSFTFQGIGTTTITLTIGGETIQFNAQVFQEE